MGRLLKIRVLFCKERGLQKPSVEEFIDVFTMFRGVPSKMIKELLAASSHMAFTKDMQIYNEGDACSSIAFILSGEIRVYKAGEGGREITLYEIESGETCIVNASCILSRRRYPAYAVATQAGDMLLLPAADFRRLIEKYEQMRDFVFAILSDRLSNVMALVEEVAFGRMDRRLVYYLIEKSDNNRLNTTHQKIADDLGTSREVVSRILKDFERKGKIRLSRNLIETVNL